jgi:hypothetical protein
MEEFFSVGIFLCGFGTESSPDLTARCAIVVEETDALTGFRRDRRRSDATGACANHDEIEGWGHSVTTSMFGAQRSWHVRRCGSPFTLARHSRQIPMPQSGARGSPLTDRLQGCPAIIIAAATLVSSET